MSDTKRPESSALSRSTAAGVLWLLAQTLANRGVGILSQLLLAWLLLPAEFGQFGLAMSIILLVGPLTSFGVDDVLLQRSSRAHIWSAPAFWMGLGAGFLSMVLVLAAAPFLSAAYRSADLIGVMAVLALAIPIASLSTVPMVTLRSQLRFKTLAVIGTTEFVAQQSLTVALAALGMGAYSFAIPAVVVGLGKGAILLWLARPDLKVGRWRLNLLILKRGSSVFLSRVLIALRHQGDIVLLGLFATQVQVGLYFFALRIAAQPVQMFAGSLNTVLFPALVQLAGDRPRQLNAALNAGRTLAFLITPICFIQAAVAQPLLTLLFASKWSGAVLPIQLLSLGLAFDGVAWVAGALLTARGHFRFGALLNAGMLVAFLLMVAAGSLHGLAVPTALAVGAFYAVVPPLYSYVVFRRYEATNAMIASMYAGPTLAAAIAMGAAWAAGHYSPWATQPFWACATVGIVGAGLYLALSRWLMPEQFEQTRYRLLSRFGKVFARSVPAPVI